MLFEMNTLIVLFHFFRYTTTFVDTILCVRFLGFLRKVVQFIFKLRIGFYQRNYRS